MTEDHTLVIYSGHPAGLFPSFPTAPRVVVTNGIVKVMMRKIYNCKVKVNGNGDIILFTRHY